MAKRPVVSLPIPASWGVASFQKKIKRAGKSGARSAAAAARKVVKLTPSQRKAFLMAGKKTSKKSSKRKGTKVVTSGSGRKYLKNLATGKVKEIKGHKILTEKCKFCQKKHAPGKHRFHGEGSYKRTHPGAYKRGEYVGYGPKKAAKRPKSKSASKGKRGKSSRGRKR